MGQLCRVMLQMEVEVTSLNPFGISCGSGMVGCGLLMINFTNIGVNPGHQRLKKVVGETVGAIGLDG